MHRIKKQSEFLLEYLKAANRLSPNSSNSPFSLERQQTTSFGNSFGSSLGGKKTLNISTIKKQNKTFLDIIVV